METAMPRPLPSAVSGFHAGTMAKDTIQYPHLPRSIAVRMPHVTYPSLTRHGKAPATKRPMGMTLPILTKMGGHPADTISQLPMVGNA
jgi:hypothetical protein